MEECFQELLVFLQSAVTPNYAQKSIGNLLNFLKCADRLDSVEVFSKLILQTLSIPPHDKLWLRVNRVTLDICVENKNFEDAHAVMAEMRQFCEVNIGALFSRVT